MKSAQSEQSLQETQSTIYRGNKEDKGKVGKRTGRERYQINPMPGTGLRGSPISHPISQGLEPRFPDRYARVIQFLYINFLPSSIVLWKYNHMLKGSTSRWDMDLCNNKLTQQGKSILGTQTTHNGKTSSYSNNVNCSPIDRLIKGIKLIQHVLPHPNLQEAFR